MTITQENAQKVLETVDAGLCSGLGLPIPGKMCVEAAVCYALGAPHSDNHECLGYAVRVFKITLNDSSWSSPEARAKGLRRIAVAQLGSNQVDQIAFVTLLAKRIGEYVVKYTTYAAKYADKYAAKAAFYMANATIYYPPNAAKYAASIAAKYAAVAAEYAAKYAANSAAKYDHVLSEAAEIAVQILVELKSPGIEFLHLCK